MAKKKNDEVESDTDPIGMKPKRKGKPKNEKQLADLILEGRSNDVQIVTVHADPPRKKRNWLKWGLIAFAVLWVLSVLFPPKDKATPTAQSPNPDLAFVGNIPTNTPRTSHTPTQDFVRETSIAQSVSTMRVVQTQGAITALPTTLTNVALSATNTPLPPNTLGIPETATAQAIASMVALSMASPTPTSIPTQVGVRKITDEGIVTGESVRVRSCASTECNQIGLMNRGVTFPITGSVADGQSVSGNSLWYQIEYEAQVGYVSATLVGLVSAQPVSAPVNQSIAPVSTVAPISVAPSTQWNCSGDVYNCTDFGSGGQFTCGQLIEYMNTCTGDPSRLDQGGEAGVACESRCG